MSILQLLLFGLIGALIGILLGDITRYGLKIVLTNSVLPKLVGLFVLIVSLFSF